MTAPLQNAAISHRFWLGAIATALIELVAKFALAPGGLFSAASASGAELALRGTAYAVLFTLSWLMRSGRAWARWALLIIFGLIGTLSLVVEPIVWIVEGGSVSTFLALADLGTWIMILSRVAHIACVWAATFFMFAPDALKRLN